MDEFQRWELEEQLRHVERVLGSEYWKDRRGRDAATPNDDEPSTAWLAMAVGLGALVVGGLLSTADLWGQPQGLWKFGLAVALIGQVALLVGLWQPRTAKQTHGVRRGTHGRAHHDATPAAADAMAPSKRTPPGRQTRLTR